MNTVQMHSILRRLFGYAKHKARTVASSGLVRVAWLKGAQHCRAEVYLKGYGWVGMDPADVAKVMRQETAEWIKTPQNPLIAPVNKALFGGWEGNWMAYNMAHDVSLPQAKGNRLGFFMYPAAENASGRLDSYAPDDFKYQISAKEI